MKPSWDDAPEWAKYRAMDEDEAWYWYEYEPVKRLSMGADGDYVGYWYSLKGQVESAEENIEDWANTLEERPAAKQWTSDCE